MINRRRFLAVLSGIFGTGCLAALYARFIEPYWVEIVERDLPVQNLPSAVAGRRLVHLSDLHIGPVVDPEYLKRSFSRVSQRVPDYVVYTGDFITSKADIGRHFEPILVHLPRGQRATFGVLGNHDYGPGWSNPGMAAQVSSLVTDAGIPILRNETAECDGLHFVGLDDLWGGRFDVATALKPVGVGTSAVVLSHNPDTVDLPGWEQYSGWILSGHTHGGQCKPPFLPPPLLPVRNRSYVSGDYSLPGRRRLYINRGLGHLMPVRFNVRPEITVFRLQTA